jgi:hypothetical protein
MRAPSESGAAVPLLVAEEETGKMLAAAIEKARAKRPSRVPFGIKGFDVAKFLISMGAAVVVAYYGMQFAIERNTAAIESNAAEVQETSAKVETIKAKVETHKDDDHGEVERRIQKVERTTDRIEVMQTQTLEAIKDLKGDIRESRRSNRRNR